MDETKISKFTKFKSSEFFNFIKKFFYFIVLISICFYLVIYIRNNTQNNTILIESKVMFYMIIIFLYFIISDILETPQESMKKFLLIIILSVIISYFCNYYIITKYNLNANIQMDSSKIGDQKLNQEISDKANQLVSEEITYYRKLLISFLVTTGIFLITSIVIFFTFNNENLFVQSKLYETFCNAINKNQNYLIFFAIYFFIITQIFRIYNINTHLTDILNPCIIGGFLIFFIFCFIIFLCAKYKIISNTQYLNTFIILSSLLVYFIIYGVYVFMGSLNEICTINEDQNKLYMEEIYNILVILSILIILWYDDSREWKWIGYFLFLVVSIFNLVSFFYLNNLFPNSSLITYWLMIEWLIILFSKRESKNSMHYVFMK